MYATDAKLIEDISGIEDPKVLTGLMKKAVQEAILDSIRENKYMSPALGEDEENAGQLQSEAIYALTKVGNERWRLEIDFSRGDLNTLDQLRSLNDQGGEILNLAIDAARNQINVFLGDLLEFPYEECVKRETAESWGLAAEASDEEVQKARDDFFRERNIERYRLPSDATEQDIEDAEARYYALADYLLIPRSFPEYERVDAVNRAIDRRVDLTQATNQTYSAHTPSSAPTTGSLSPSDKSPSGPHNVVTPRELPSSDSEIGGVS